MDLGAPGMSLLMVRGLGRDGGDGRREGVCVLMDHNCIGVM